MKIRRISDPFVRKFRMRLMHISDTHGHFPRLYGRFNTILHTGDLFPNSHHAMAGNRVKEMEFQMRWLENSISDFKQWLQGHPFLYVPGNHDFLHSSILEYELHSYGMIAKDLTDKIVSHEGINFYGFPYVPFINSLWNYERQIPEMQKEVDVMVDVLNKQYVDVLACHSPPHQCLDLTMGNDLIGSTVLANALDYKINKDMMPTTYCCGHVHEGAGITLRNGLLVSNAATSQQILEI